MDRAFTAKRTLTDNAIRAIEEAAISNTIVLPHCCNDRSCIVDDELSARYSANFAGDAPGSPMHDEITVFCGACGVVTAFVAEKLLTALGYRPEEQR